MEEFNNSSWEVKELIHKEELKKGNVILLLEVIHLGTDLP